jgi:hypothetical protein
MSCHCLQMFISKITKRISINYGVSIVNIQSITANNFLLFLFKSFGGELQLLRPIQINKDTLAVLH